MATLFHLPSTGSLLTTTNPAFDAGWEQTGQAVRLPMWLERTEDTRTALATSTAITVPITTTQQILCYQFVSNDVFVPTQFGTDCTIRSMVMALESATSANTFIAYSLKAVSPDGARDLGILVSKLASGGTEYAAVTRATRISGPTAFTATSVREPFRLVYEIGCHAAGPSAGGSYTLRIGNPVSTADFAFTTALTTDLCTWMDISYDLNKLLPNTYLPRATVNNTGIISVTGN